MEDCIFCKIVKGEIPSIRIYEDDQVFAFADINPISDGHTLIVPKKHAQDIWEIPVEDLAAVHSASKKVAAAIKGAIDAEGIACVQLNGRAVNQVVMHYHLHLIPRVAGGPELPVTGWEIKPGDKEKVKNIGQKIAAAL